MHGNINLYSELSVHVIFLQVAGCCWYETLAHDMQTEQTVLQICKRSKNCSPKIRVFAGVV